MAAYVACRDARACQTLQFHIRSPCDIVLAALKHSGHAILCRIKANATVVSVGSLESAGRFSFQRLQSTIVSAVTNSSACGLHSVECQRTPSGCHTRLGECKQFCCLFQTQHGQGSVLVILPGSTMVAWMSAIPKSRVPRTLNAIGASCKSRHEWKRCHSARSGLSVSKCIANT